uniref:Uncharacterized protein n=1 Tax=Hyaloperonospora arabidopsidis (strain Emoy2) TaxID=559515 RepID=M4BJL4_HYAAE
MASTGGVRGPSRCLPVGLQTTSRIYSATCRKTASFSRPTRSFIGFLGRSLTLRRIAKSQRR